MKIAYVYDSIYPYSIGGCEKKIWELSTRLTGRGHEPHIFGPKYWQGEDTIKKDDVYLHGVCKPPRKRFISSRRPITEAIYFAWKVLPPLLKEKFDVIDCHNFPYFPCFSAKLASITRKSPLIITWDQFWGNYWYEYLGTILGLFGRVLEKLALKLPTKVITISDRVKQDLITAGFKEDKIRVIVSGTNFEEIQQIEPRGESYDIIYVGRLVDNKHVDVLLKAISIVRKQIVGVKCAIIGDGPEREQLQNLTGFLGLQENIKFLGLVRNHEDVVSFMKSSKIFASASIREGLPQTILEANASGIPAIIVDHRDNGATSVISDGENGFKEALSEEAIASRILQLLTDEKLLASMKQKAINRTRSHDWSIIVTEVEKVYQEVLDRV